MNWQLFDIEGDGLLNKITTVWCMASQNLHTGENFWVGPESIQEGIAQLQAADVIVGHNIIGYDLPALWKLYGKWKKYPLIIDTLVVSRALWPERQDGHSLDAWGKRLGCHKIEFNDFSQFSLPMLSYCQQDVALNVQVFKELDKEMIKQYGTPLQGYKVYT